MPRYFFIIHILTTNNFLFIVGKLFVILCLIIKF